MSSGTCAEVVRYHWRGADFSFSRHPANCAGQ